MQNSSMLIAALIGACVAVILLLVVAKIMGFSLSRTGKSGKKRRDFDLTQVEEQATQQFEDPRDDPPTQQLR